jgi:hypothetical protein
MHVTNDIPLGCSLLLPVGTANCIQTEGPQQRSLLLLLLKALETTR